MLKKGSDVQAKAQKIKAIILDVDGVLTDGGIWYDRHTNEFKRFNTKDGMIVKPLQNLGFIVGAITGKDSESTMYRCNQLNLDFHFHGSSDKRVHYKHVKDEFKLTDEQICYIGDDMQDLPIFTRCGLSACPSDARQYMHDQADLVTLTKGGEGVFRDVADYILTAQGLFDDLLNKYLTM